jgi:hypothetical protein
VGRISSDASEGLRITPLPTDKASKVAALMKDRRHRLGPVVASWRRLTVSEGGHTRCRRGHRIDAIREDIAEAVAKATRLGLDAVYV